ncbi:sensor histidine kinase [Cellulomonas marina]|uniref:histidine kinase n=1 Tax=Cellulomonas marina TaxID=988821 RepID=A0A1I0WPX4_9CELL|nr:HAMP domain-containing sensor histidine kinase [Cellulomonas marina]GIG27804.1 two-component sensor histidine kinase [Cellulomonas marina]SFA90819.1 two-component system, OmpR family, sensor kinase [Cellulomonas marina]
MASRPARVPGRWTLRRRLVAVLVLLLVASAATTGVVSTIALRGSLVDQLDERLVQASDRAGRFGPGGERGPVGDGVVGDGVVGDGVVGDGVVGPGGPPPQDVGTLALYADDGVVEQAGYYSAESGTFVALTDAQADRLLAVPAGGGPVTVDVAGLGGYRVLATSTDDGRLVVTGLSLSDVGTTVEGYVLVQVLVALVVLGVGVVVGLLLVRRELRPLDRVAATARRVAALPLSRGEVAIPERVAAADTDPATEVGQVGAALNGLLHHVERALADRQASETQVRQFVADASHELRTPLASIRGYAELVRRSPETLPADARQALARVESESRRMTALVEDLLLLARLDAGRPLAEGSVDLVALAVDAVADAHAAGRDHVWRLDLGTGDDEEPPDVLARGDEDRLRQVLANLLSNARLHTPPGTVVTVGARADGARVRLVVADDGPGIDPALRDRLFQRFTRGDASRNRASGTTGLGLAIVDAVVGAHGGAIAVESAVAGERPDGRHGTTFTVTLPAHGVPRPAPVAAGQSG